MEQKKGNPPTQGQALEAERTDFNRRLLKVGMDESEIACLLGRDRRTIGREIEQGQVEHLKLRPDHAEGVQRQPGSRRA